VHHALYLDIETGAPNKLKEIREMIGTIEGRKRMAAPLAIEIDDDRDR